MVDYDDVKYVVEEPHFQVQYRDDNNNKHFINLINSRDVDFLRERFEIDACDYVGK